MSRAAAILWLSRRDRTVVAGALAGIVVLAWTYILLGAGVDTAMNMAMGDVMMPMPWTLTTFRVMLVMWIVMMTAMMLPSAAPMILLFVTINRRRSETGTPYATGLFALAYWALWAAFSIAATCAQWGLEHARLLSATMATASTSLAGAVSRHQRSSPYRRFLPIAQLSRVRSQSRTQAGYECEALTCRSSDSDPALIRSSRYSAAAAAKRGTRGARISRTACRITRAADDRPR
jgi:hypothetical protein